MKSPWPAGSHNDPAGDGMTTMELEIELSETWRDTVKDDYLSAGLRHFSDSETLRRQNRMDNSAYLAGYAIECGLKLVLEVHGHAARAYGHNLDVLSRKGLVLAAMLSPGLSRYRVNRIKSLANAIAVWNPEMRYDTTGDVTPESVKAICESAHAMVSEVMASVLLDGRSSRT